MKLVHKGLTMYRSSADHHIREADGTAPTRVPRYWIVSTTTKRGDKRIEQFFAACMCPIDPTQIQRGIDNDVYAHILEYPGKINSNTGLVGTAHIHHPDSFESVLFVSSQAATMPAYGSSIYDGRVVVELTGRWRERVADFKRIGFKEAH